MFLELAAGANLSAKSVGRTPISSSISITSPVGFWFSPFEMIISPISRQDSKETSRYLFTAPLKVISFFKSFKLWGLIIP